MIYHLSFDLGQKNAYVSATILEKNTEGNLADIFIFFYFYLCYIQEKKLTFYSACKKMILNSGVASIEKSTRKIVFHFSFCSSPGF